MSGAKMQIHEFEVPMTCDGCKGAIQKVLGKLPAGVVENVDVDVKANKVKITSTAPVAELMDVLKKTGKTVKHLTSTDA